MSVQTQIGIDDDTAVLRTYFRLDRIARAMQARVGARLTGHGLQRSDLDVLAPLYLDGQPHEMPLTDLIRWSGVSNSTMTGRLDRLVRAGLVERGLSPSNRRKMDVRLTDGGIRLTAAALDSGAVELLRVATALTDEDHRVVGRVLDKLESLC